MQIKIGDYVKFVGTRGIHIFGFICRIHDDSVDYVRDSLTKWNVSKSLVERGTLISEDNFISRVQYNASGSDHKIPSIEEIKSVLEIYKTNFDADIEQIYSVLNIPI